MGINDIVNAIAIKLNQVFGDTYEIYTEEIEQGFKEPCFFIGFLSAEEAQVFGRRYHDGHLFDIHYFPREGNTEIFGMMNTLKDALEYVMTIEGDLLRGTNINLEIVNGVLHTFVNYNFHIYKPKTVPQEAMEGFEHQAQIKRGV